MALHIWLRARDDDGKRQENFVLMLFEMMPIIT